MTAVSFEIDYLCAD